MEYKSVATVKIVATEKSDIKIKPPLNTIQSRNWIINQSYGAIINKDLQGPTRESNWLIPKTPNFGSLLVGGYPDKLQYLSDILAAGIDTFVCLNVEYGRMTDTHIYNSYAVNKLAADKFIHEPIKDMDIGYDNNIKSLCQVIVERLYNGENIYLHCSGGHGRTGTVAAIVLHILYPELNILQIFDYLQFAHDQRAANYFGEYYFIKWIQSDPLSNYFVKGQVPTPQTSEQRQQVSRIILELILENEEEGLEDDLDSDASFE
jgi:hypothetical protein